MPTITFKNGERIDCDMERCQNERNWLIQIAEDHEPEGMKKLTGAQIAFLGALAGKLAPIQWDEFSVSTLDYDKALILQAAFHQARKEQNIPLRDALTRRVRPLSRPSLHHADRPVPAAARPRLCARAYAEGRVRAADGGVRCRINRRRPSRSRPNAGAEPAWQVLEGIDPDTAEFPALTRVGDERILVLKIGDGFRGVERGCPHQQRSLHDAFLQERLDTMPSAAAGTTMCSGCATARASTARASQAEGVRREARDTARCWQA